MIPTVINMMDTVPRAPSQLIVPHYYFTWDYKGYEVNVGEGGHLYMQHDWNQTLITKINQTSANIAKHSWRGGGNTIETSGVILTILEDLEYFNIQEMSIAARYKVIVNRKLPLDLLVVYHDCPDYLKFKVDYPERGMDP